MNTKHQPMEALLDSWWDAEERKSILQAIAYGLSRSAFLELPVMLWGPPSSAGICHDCPEPKKMLKNEQGRVFVLLTTDLNSSPQFEK